LLLAAATLLIVVGLATHANVVAGSSSPSKGRVGLVFDVVVVGSFFVALVVGFVVTWALVPERIYGRAPRMDVRYRRRTKKEWMERILTILIEAALFGGIVAALMLTHSLHYTHHTLPSLGNPFKNGLRPFQAEAHQQEVQYVNWGLAAAAGGGTAALILLGASALFLFHRARESGGQPPPLFAATPLEAVEIGIDELEAEPDPGRAVIRSYAAMEASLSRHGVHRRPTDAPFEYLRRALVKGGAPQSATTQLTELFEQARFSHHVIGSTVKAEALEALVDIRECIRAANTPRKESGPWAVAKWSPRGGWPLHWLVLARGLRRVTGHLDCAVSRSPARRVGSRQLSANSWPSRWRLLGRSAKRHAKAGSGG
jgi:hypothetical protein